jgi:hypothetical protein
MRLLGLRAPTDLSVGGRLLVPTRSQDRSSGAKSSRARVVRQREGPRAQEISLPPLQTLPHSGPLRCSCNAGFSDVELAAVSLRAPGRLAPPARSSASGSTITRLLPWRLLRLARFPYRLKGWSEVFVQLRLRMLGCGAGTLPTTAAELEDQLARHLNGLEPKLARTRPKPAIR